MVQNRHAGEQGTHQDKTNKEISFKMLISVNNNNNNNFFQMSTESVFFTLTGVRIKRVEFRRNVGAFTGTEKTYIV